MFGTACHPILSTLAHFNHLKGQLSLLIFHNFLNAFNHKLFHLRVYCLYIGIHSEPLKTWQFIFDYNFG